MSEQFKQAVAWWLRAKDLQVKEVLDVKVEDTRGGSAETGEWGSEDIEVIYLNDKNIRQRYSEEVNFAEFAVGKIPVPDKWVKAHNFSASTGPRLKLLTKAGASVSSAAASVQEHVTKTYSIAWRTTW